MGFLKNHKIYKKYYPLTTEEQRDEFVKNERNTISDTIDSRIRLISNDRQLVDLEYIQKYKETISPFGNFKPSAAYHNYRVSCDQKFDRRYLHFENEESKVRNVSSAFQTGALTIEETNQILRWMNSAYSKYVGQAIMIIVLAGVIGILCQIF